MTAKAKAIQAVIALSVTALTVTVYNSVSNQGTPAKEPAIKESTMDPIIIRAKSTKLMDPVIITTTKKAKAATPASTDNSDNIPGYSNPDEKSR